MSDKIISTITQGQTLQIVKGSDGSNLQNLAAESPVRRTLDWKKRLNSVLRDIDDPQYASIANLYGHCQPLFDLCADDALMSFCMAGGMNPLVDWLNFRPTNIWKKQRHFISYIGNEGTAAGAPISTYQGAIDCDDCGIGPTTEWGSCDFVCEGFDSFKASSPVRNDICETIQYCESSPTYRIDGSLIADNDEWDMVQMTTTMMADFHRWLIDGTYGLQNQINFGYTSSDGTDCSAMDAHVIDLNQQPLCPEDGMTGVTYNGQPLTDGTFTFIDLLRSVVQLITRRINMAPGITGAPQMALVMPSEWIDCVLRCFVCWSVCGCSVERMDSFEARDMLRDLEDSGLFAQGVLNIRGTLIPLVSYDYGLIDDATGAADFYLLTRAAGNTPFIEPEFLNQNGKAARRPGVYTVTDGGLLSFYDNWEHGCYQQHEDMNPRICMPAPWAQVRFTNAVCELTPEPMYMSCDPLSQYYINQPLVAQESSCPDPDPDPGP